MQGREQFQVGERSSGGKGMVSWERLWEDNLGSGLSLHGDISGEGWGGKQGS